MSIGIGHFPKDFTKKYDNEKEFYTHLDNTLETIDATYLDLDIE